MTSSGTALFSRPFACGRTIVLNRGAASQHFGGRIDHILFFEVPGRGGAPWRTKNGSPWRWPLFPWSLFVVMAGGAIVRCYSLCVSFHYVGGNRTIFGPYFLVPIGLALALVWLEIGIAGRCRGVMVAASIVPLSLVLLAATGHRDEHVYQHSGRLAEQRRDRDRGSIANLGFDGDRRVF
jgi:hypothetical protein